MASVEELKSTRLKQKESGLWSSLSKIRKDLEEFNICFDDLLQVSTGPGPSPQNTVWKWSLEPTGFFSVCSLRRLIDARNSPGLISGEILWLKTVPSKVNIMMWRLRQMRLASLCNLFFRGISIDSLCCFLCKNSPKSEEHLFGSCNVFRSLLISFAGWWGADVSLVNSLDSLFSWGCNLGYKGKLLVVFNTALFALCWVVWKLRNALAFPSGDKISSDRFGMVQSISLFWLNTRGKLKIPLSWFGWSCNPLQEISS